MTISTVMWWSFGFAAFVGLVSGIVRATNDGKGLMTGSDGDWMLLAANAVVFAWVGSCFYFAITDPSGQDQARLYEQLTGHRFRFPHLPTREGNTLGGLGVLMSYIVLHILGAAFGRWRWPQQYRD